MKTHTMRNNKVNILPIFGTFMLIFLVMISCSKDDDGTSGEPIKMFTPGEVSTQSFDTEARLTWDASLFTGSIAETYTAQVSEDSLFTNLDEVLVEKQTDTTGIVFTDQELEVRKKYFARIKANAIDDRPESNWTRSYSFRITGIQILYPLYSPEVLSTSATVRWATRDGVSSISIREYTQVEGEDPVYIGEPVVLNITAEEVAAGAKVVTGLNPETKYQVDLYQGNLSVGYRSFQTKAIAQYSVTLTEADDLSDAIDASITGDVIALEPGTYDESDTNFNITGKSISIVSTSNNPNDTKVLFKEFTLSEDGAGVTVRGIELDGQGTNYLINLTGSTGVFDDVLIDNCIVHDVNTSAFRANRGDNSGYFMNAFSIRYSVFYNFSPANYGFLHLDELIFNEINLTNSTFYSAADIFIRNRQSLDAPGPVPTVTIDYCTLNSIGSSSNYTLYDGSSVDANLNITNSVLANIPQPGSTVGESLLRLDGSNSS
ncbi:MAG: DUF4957 domain-containing protein, partial [Leeuwenhoekiella sp.]